MKIDENLQNLIFTTEKRRRGDTEKSRGKAKSKTNTKSKPENSENTENCYKIASASGTEQDKNQF